MISFIAFVAFLFAILWVLKYIVELHGIKQEMNFSVKTEKEATIVANKLSSYSRLISKLKVDLKKDRDSYIRS